MKTTRFLVAGLLGSAATAAFLAAPASAQTTDTGQAAPVVDDDNVIVVTARRREESIQDVPLSIFPPVRVVLSSLIHAQLSPAAPLQKSKASPASLLHLIRLS